jgi:hypothetical protein
MIHNMSFRVHGDLSYEVRRTHAAGQDAHVMHGAAHAWRGLARRLGRPVGRVTWGSRAATGTPQATYPHGLL